MATKQLTTQTNQYDPTSMEAFKGMTGAMSPILQGYMNNPFGNPFFQMQQQLGRTQAGQLGGSAMSNIGNNITASGIGGGGSSSPFQQEMMQNQARANTGLTSQMGFLAPTQSALGLQQNALQTAAGYRPLQTGQNQVQSTTGLGTWLPQLISGGLGALNPLQSLMGSFGGGGGGGTPGGSMLSGGFAGAGAPNPFFGGQTPFGGSFGMPSLGGYAPGGQYNMAQNPMGGGR